MSTTDRNAKGQALAVFALSLTAVLLAGALAFDGGLVFVERRDQQNAADAAALAGARYLTSSTAAARSAATSAASELATANGFTDGADSAQVAIHVPPVSGPHAGQNGYIEVQIGSVRPSVFAGLAGIFDWNVSARAVALNNDGAGADFSILALDPLDCNAFKVTGSGSATAAGDIQVNSECTNGAMTAGGGGAITVLDLGVTGNCNVVGIPPNSIDEDGGGSISCNKNMGAKPIADPLVGLPQPWEPGDAPPPLAAPPQYAGTGASPSIPRYCPGGQNAMSWTSNNKACKISDGNAWRLYPGMYPGGLDLTDGTIYFMPGIYYIIGGGLSVGSGTEAYTVNSSGNLVAGEAAGGVLFFNTEHPTGSKWSPVQFNGGSADFEVLPLDATSAPDSNYNGILIWNDRRFPDNDEDGNSITLNGGSSNMSARGTIYSARGEVSVNGNSDVDSELIVDQAIAFNFSLNGNGGSIVALADDDYVWKPNAAGLVE